MKLTPVRSYTWIDEWTSAQAICDLCAWQSEIGSRTFVENEAWIHEEKHRREEQEACQPPLPTL